MADYLPGEGTWTDPNKPPMPVGYGPGFVAWDPLSAQWRPTVEHPAGGYAFSGENTGDQAGQAGHAAGASADAGYKVLSQRARDASPHFNSALALEYAKAHPENLGGHFEQNPNISRLALGAGWQPPQGWQARDTPGGVPPPSGTGVLGAGTATGPYGNVDFSGTPGYGAPGGVPVTGLGVTFGPSSSVLAQQAAAARRKKQQAQKQSPGNWTVS